MGPVHAAPPAYSSGRGGGDDGKQLTGRVGMDYWMHIGILFFCQEIYSIVRKSIPLTVPFFITVQGHNSDFRMHTHRHSSDGLMWQGYPIPLYQA